MPIPAAVAAAGVNAGANILSQGINAASTGRMNKKARKFARQQAEQARRWALEDWAMQNEYNHPAAQMQRLKEAQLNPNLVYGNGADATSGPVRSSELAQFHGKPIEFDLGSAAAGGLQSFYDAQIKEATIDNLRQQNSVLKQDELLKASQVISTNQNVKTSAFDLEMKNMLKDISLQAAQADLDKTRADMQFTIAQNERAAIQQQASLAENAERILTMRAERATSSAQRQRIYAEIENIRKDGRLKDLDINLRNMGINPNDPIYMRMLGQLINGKTGGKFSEEEKQKQLKNFKMDRSYLK